MAENKFCSWITILALYELELTWDLQVCSCQDASKHWVHNKQKSKKKWQKLPNLLNLLHRNRD